MPLTIQPHFDLQSYNTLAVPAVAEYFVEVADTETLRDALVWAKENNKPVLILGGGSNVVLPPVVEALVIRNAIQGIEVVSEQGDEVLLQAGAGVVWNDLVAYTLSQNIFGLENLSLIPGTVGAAPMQNIGAYGVELESVFDHLLAMDRQSLQVEQFSKAQCQFDYRDSIFKNQYRHRFVITHVTFKLSKAATINISYPALAQVLGSINKDELTPQKISAAVCEVRRSKLPDPDKIPNAGSFFKNPIVTAAQLQALRQQHPEVVCFPAAPGHFKIAAGWLVDRAGWRGKSENGVGVHAQQALVLVNPGRQHSHKLLALAREIQNDVQLRFGIQLEIEPDVVQFHS